MFLTICDPELLNVNILCLICKHFTKNQTFLIFLRVCQRTYFAETCRNAKKYCQKYCRLWESGKGLKPWLTGIPEEPIKAWCTFCRTEYHAQHGSLIKHRQTDKHISDAKPFSTSRTMDQFGFTPKLVNNSVKLQN